MNLTIDQIVALAPDEKAVAAGKKLATAAPWKNTGQNQAALWGECQGSALYQVRIALGELAYRCTCPSRKLPCKHVLGLLLLAAGASGKVPTQEPPGWVADWLEQRSARAEKQKEKEAQPPKPVDAAAQAKRQEKRQERVAAGLERFDLWLGDLVRNGLATLEMYDASLWETQVKRLVDAQMPGLATRLRRISEIPKSVPDWPQLLLAELGQVALLSQAYRRIDELPPPLQADIRQMIGWTVSQEELTAVGETIEDRWLVLGQKVEDEDRVRVQRNWLLGRTTARTALLLQFAAGGQTFPEMIVAGTCIEGQLVFWPSALPQRARFTRRGNVEPIREAPPAAPHIDAFLETTATALAFQPWLDRFLCVLDSVIPVPAEKNGDPWVIRDRQGKALPLDRRNHWQLLALSGGHPLGLVGQWDRRSLVPFGVYTDHHFTLLNAATE